jgi:maltose-binding protein MalE
LPDICFLATFSFKNAYYTIHILNKTTIYIFKKNVKKYSTEYITTVKEKRKKYLVSCIRINVKVE